jgi:hypothetical protein
MVVAANRPIFKPTDLAVSITTSFGKSSADLAEWLLKQSGKLYDVSKDYVSVLATSSAKV